MSKVTLIRTADAFPAESILEHVRRFDRRAIDRKCDGCPRTTDRDYLTAQGLWVAGIAYRDDCHAALE